MDEDDGYVMLEALDVNATHVPDPCKRRAELGDVLKVQYVGKVRRTGKVFASSFHTGSIPYRFTLDGPDAKRKKGPVAFHNAWNRALVDMCEGERRSMAVPAALGFGKAGTKGVPPNADLTYFVELVELSKGRNRRNRKRKKEL